MNRRPPRRRWIVHVALCCAVCASAGLALAKQGVIKTRDGRSLEGDVTEKSDGYVVTIRGIPTTVARENVESVQYLGNIEQQYKDKLANLKNPTAKDHLDLARWLFDNKAYELARREVDAALVVDPNNADATTLYATIQSQLRLEHSRPAGGSGTTPTATTPKPPTPPGPGSATTTTAPPHTASLHKYLTADQINEVKQAEWPSDDTSVKISFTGDVKRKYLASAQENAAAFNALSPSEQARRILANGTAEERAAIRVNNDPQPLAEFKRTIQPMILTGCATAACHGGPKGGKLFLYPNPDDAASYTNFYLLTQASAEVGGAKRMMFDRTYADQSLLDLWGLPAEITKSSHPEVKGVAWHSLFASTQDPKYRTVMNWIGHLVKPDPTYGFTFSLDAASATGAAPAEAPAPAAPNTRPAAPVDRAKP
jgi:hypothetical protein